MNRSLKTIPSRLLLSAFLAAGLTVAAVASAKLKVIDKPKVEFQAVGPAGLKIDGTGSTLSGSEEDGKLKLTAAINNLKTGIGLRDKHLKKAIDADKHPKAVLVVERSDLKMPDDKKTVSGKAAGQFTLHGVTKPLSFNYQAKRTGSDYHVQGNASVDITQFNIEKPCYLGVCVNKDVKIKVAFKLRDES